MIELWKKNSQNRCWTPSITLNLTEKISANSTQMLNIYSAPGRRSPVWFHLFMIFSVCFRNVCKKIFKPLYKFPVCMQTMFTLFCLEEGHSCVPDSSLWDCVCPCAFMCVCTSVTCVTRSCLCPSVLILCVCFRTVSKVCVPPLPKISLL